MPARGAASACCGRPGRAPPPRAFSGLWTCVHSGTARRFTGCHRESWATQVSGMLVRHTQCGAVHATQAVRCVAGGADSVLQLRGREQL